VDGLHDAGLADEKIAALQGDLTGSVFTEKEMALLLLAETLTVDPPASDLMTRKAVEAGWTETEVAHAIFVVSYFNMVTRIADAFTLPPDESHPYDPATVLPMLRCRED
jgi:alkylhydroperoxidase family enzyme